MIPFQVLFKEKFKYNDLKSYVTLATKALVLTVKEGVLPVSSNRPQGL